MSATEFFALAAFWLGASLIVTLLLIGLHMAAWKLMRELAGWPLMCRLLIAAREAGGIEKAIQKLKDPS